MCLYCKLSGLFVPSYLTLKLLDVAFEETIFCKIKNFADFSLNIDIDFKKNLKLTFFHP